MKKYHSILPIIFFTLLFQSAWAQREVVVPFSGGNAEKRLEITVSSGSIVVQGTDRSDALIKYKESDRKNNPCDDCPAMAGENRDKEVEGLKKISGGQADIEIRERSNVIEINSESWFKGMDLEIEVPKNIHVEIRTQFGQKIELNSVNGHHNIESSMGEITGEGISGSVNASTHTGAIRLGFDQIDTDQKMIFTNTAGNIDLTLPSNIQADLKMRTSWGEIYSDLDLVMQEQEPTLEKSKGEDGLYVFREDWRKAKLNGGGEEITIKTKMGNIYLRKN